MRENMDQKNPEYGHFSRSIKNGSYIYITGVNKIKPKVLVQSEFYIIKGRFYGNGRLHKAQNISILNAIGEQLKSSK